MKILNSLAVRKKFGEVLDEVHDRKVHIAISRANRPLVVMIPYEEYQEKNGPEDREKRLRQVSTSLKEWRLKNRRYLSGVDPVELIRSTRDTR